MASTADDGMEEKSMMDTNSDATGSVTESNSNFTEDLVKKDNFMVMLVRATVIVILLSAAAVTSYLNFKFTRNAEVDAFNEAFHGVAAKLVPGLLSELSLRVSNILLLMLGR